MAPFIRVALGFGFLGGVWGCPGTSSRAEENTCTEGTLGCPRTTRCGITAGMADGRFQ